MMHPKYPPGTSSLQIYINTMHKILRLLNYSKYKSQQKTANPLKDQTTVTMASHIPIIGITQTEKLAEGLCPCCRSMICMWLTPQGVEVSVHGKEYEITLLK